MSSRLLLRPAAVADLREAFEWYEDKQAGLGQEFILAVELKLTQIQQNPQQFPKVQGNTRRAIVRRFPFGIFFVTGDNAVAVLAVMHHARAPSRWQSRS